jgi:hypothetical protein
MTVHLKPEQAAVVGEAIRAGLIESPDDVLTMGVETIRRRLGMPPAEAKPTESTPSGEAVPVHLRARNLVELFAESPFKGLELDFERDRDTGRDIEL